MLSLARLWAMTIVTNLAGGWVVTAIVMLGFPALHQMAIDSRRPLAGTIIHSDQGSQFGSRAFTDRAKDSGLVPSMGSVGDCYDNSMIEAFWSRMQVELLDRQSWRTRIELANAIFEYLEIWHNRRRRHSALGWVSPLEFENQSKIVVA